ncbi:hypothetical protein AgCh_027422 [Apium graveolens]
MNWLDSQSYRSVIYVSFGSVATVTRDQLMEFWDGLFNSGCKFLWVIRADTITGDGEIPEEVLQGTKERGYIVGWAPQEEVLGHQAAGGFFDSQWMEFDVGEWLKGILSDRVIVEKMIKDMMVERKDKFLKSADRMASLAKSGLSEGGSSYSNLERLIDDIKTIGVVR